MARKIFSTSCFLYLTPQRKRGLSSAGEMERARGKRASRKGKRGEQKKKGRNVFPRGCASEQLVRKKRKNSSSASRAFSMVASIPPSVPAENNENIDPREKRRRIIPTFPRVWGSVPVTSSSSSSSSMSSMSSVSIASVSGREKERKRKSPARLLTPGFSGAS